MKKMQRILNFIICCTLLSCTILILVSCLNSNKIIQSTIGKKSTNLKKLKAINKNKDKDFDVNNLNKYFFKTYLNKGYFLSDISDDFKRKVNGMSRSDLNNKPDESSKIQTFKSKHVNQENFIKNIGGIAIRKKPPLPKDADLKLIFKAFNVDQKYILNFNNFIKKYYQSKVNNIIGYNFYSGKNKRKTLIRAKGGPSNNINPMAGLNTYMNFRLKDEYDIIILNDSQYSFDPIKLEQQINNHQDNIGYLDAFEKLFEIPLQMDNYTKIKLINFALAYIDAQRIKQIQEYCIDNNTDPYLYGFSQGYITLQMSMLIDSDILFNAKKIRIENCSMRSIVGLFKKDDETNYNVRGIGVLTKENIKDAASKAKATGGMDYLFGISKRLFVYGENLLAIYQTKFNNNPKFLKSYQDKVNVSFSKKDWNIGDITPKEINFFQKNKINMRISPIDGHNMNFPIKDYVEWLGD